VKYSPLFHHFKAIYQFPKHIKLLVKIVANYFHRTVFQLYSVREQVNNITNYNKYKKTGDLDIVNIIKLRGKYKKTGDLRVVDKVELRGFLGERHQYRQHMLIIWPLNFKEALATIVQCQIFTFISSF
jgi:hypothetical protein